MAKSALAEAETERGDENLGVCVSKMQGNGSPVPQGTDRTTDPFLARIPLHRMPLPIQGMALTIL